MLSHWSPQKGPPCLDIGKIMFVNFEVGALEKRIKFKTGRAHLSVAPDRVDRAYGRPVPRRPPTTRLPPVAALRCRLHVRRPSALSSRSSDEEGVSLLPLLCSSPSSEVTHSSALLHVPSAHRPPMSRATSRVSCRLAPVLLLHASASPVAKPGTFSGASRRASSSSPGASTRTDSTGHRPSPSSLPRGPRRCGIPP
jgi:hypothetical protein